MIDILSCFCIVVCVLLWLIFFDEWWPLFVLFFVSLFIFYFFNSFFSFSFFFCLWMGPKYVNESNFWKQLSRNRVSFEILKVLIHIKAGISTKATIKLNGFSCSFHRGYLRSRVFLLLFQVSLYGGPQGPMIALFGWRCSMQAGISMPECFVEPNSLFNQELGAKVQG